MFYSVRCNARNKNRANNWLSFFLVAFRRRYDQFRSCNWRSQPSTCPHGLYCITILMIYKTGCTGSLFLNQYSRLSVSLHVSQLSCSCTQKFIRFKVIHSLPFNHSNSNSHTGVISDCCVENVAYP